MSVENNVNDYSVSNHCKQRYAERIMGRDSNVDINQYVASNEDKIKTDINKLIRYGEMIYSGKQSHKDSKGEIVDVFLKDCWVVLVGNKSRNVITLYKIDLGLDDEFNKSYIAKMMEKLNTQKEILIDVQQQTQDESNTYKNMIEEAETQIKEYRTMIKNLEELCSGYKIIIDNNHIKTAKASKDVIDILNTLIGKREF